MTVTTETPGGTVERVNELLSAGDLEALVGLYEPDATFVPVPGRVVSGRESIRGELERLIALDPRMTATIERVLQVGDTALVACRWQLEGTAPDGRPIRNAGLSSDVLRRRPDGSWALIIDDPYGAAAHAD